MGRLQALQVTRVWLEIWTDGTHCDGRPYDRIALRIQRDESAAGLRGVWFVLDRSEIDAIVRGTQTQFEDGYHRLSILDNECTFYDFEFPSRDAGMLQVPYFRLEIPRALWRYFARIARFVWREQRAAIASGAGYDRPYRIEVPIELALIERFQRRYHRGAGSVDVRLSERCAADAAKRDGLKERVDQVTNIARNSTRNVYQTACVIVSNDLDGYFWNALAPSGRSVMHGGIINHARDGEADRWSIHT